MNHTDKAFHLTKIVIALMVAIVLDSCQSQADLPSARYGAKMIFDPVENQAILFGGRAEGMFGLKYFDDLWVFDYLAQTWTPIKTAPRPPARLSPGMAYDPVNHQIILFGGDSAQDRLGDTWIYNIADNRWQEVTPANSPPPRSDMGMTYDEVNHTVIMFGGYCQESSRDLCDDTWVYDPKTVAWTEMSPALSPPIMYGHTLVYDPSSHQSILWGGHMSAFQNGTLSSIGYGNSIWRYDYPENSWQETAHARNPSARYWHQSAFDTTNGNLLLFGGYDGHGYLADTWLFSAMDNTWESVNVKDSPSPRINAAITYDPVNEIVILFGGLGDGQIDLQDTWVFKETEVSREWINIQRDKWVVSPLSVAEVCLP